MPLQPGSARSGADASEAGRHARHLIILKKILGSLLLAYGILALLTPFTPGAFLALLGAEYLGIRLLFWERLKARLATPTGRVATIVASVMITLFSLGVLATFLAFRQPSRQFAPITLPPLRVELPGRMQVGEHTVRVEIARTPAQHARGLSHRDALAPDRGMLFVFPEAAPRTFWMKDTRIALDLIWIRAGKVLGVTANVRPQPGVPDDRLRRYRSPGPVDAVLEVNAGWAAAHGVRHGTPVALPP